MEQQQQLLQQHNEWLRAELSKKSDELLSARKAASADALEAANELERVKKEAAAAVRDLGGAKEEAARAYDRMMVWCELHGQDSRGGAKHANKSVPSGFTTVPLNFEYGEYESDFERLRQISQDDLVQNLRRQGRLQAASNNSGGQPGERASKKAKH